MSENVFDVLSERGFIEQVSDEQGIRAAVEQPITCYVGFDPSAASFHVGHLVPIMALAHMQRHGHRPIALMGGGTGMIGDPSDKDEMRRLLTVEQIDANVAKLKAADGQSPRFFRGPGADGQQRRLVAAAQLPRVLA